MAIQKQVRTVLMAALVALSVGLPAVQAYAKPANPQPTLCYYQDPDTGEINFYLPGEVWANSRNQAYVCGEGGRVYRVGDLVGAPAQTVLPGHTATPVAP
jgi:hypothetical protein